MVSVEHPGRPRDPRIDSVVLDVARRHLAAHGFHGMSVAAIAAEAGTTRQAVYRRWPSKTDLADAAVSSDPAAAEVPSERLHAGPLEALAAELRDFARGISRPFGISMVGTMLQETTAPAMLRRYRQRIVAPRRQRIRTILDRAARDGILAADADLELATTIATGSWYAIALAGDRVPADWPERMSRLILRACGARLTSPDTAWGA